MEKFKKLVISPSSVFAVLVAAILTALVSLILPTFANSVIIGTPNIGFAFLLGFGILAAFALVPLLAHFVRRSLLADDHLSRLKDGGIKSFVRSYLALLAVLLLAVAIVGLIYGAISVATYQLASLSLGLQEIKGVIGVVTQVITVLVSALIFILLSGFTFFGFGIVDNLKKSLGIFKRAYLPLIASILVAIGTGYLLCILLWLIESTALCTALTLLCYTLFGSLFLLSTFSISASVLPVNKDAQISGDTPAEAERSFLSERARRIARNTISCILSFVLTVSLLGIIEPAHANPLEQAKKITPPVEIKNAQGTNTALEAPLPKDPDAKEPIAYYDEEEPKGELVAATETSAIYQTGDKTFSTIIGGVDKTYTDVAGTHLIDNTLKPAVTQAEGAVYTPAANGYVAKLPVEITKDSGIRIEQDDTYIELIPQTGDFSRSTAKDNAIRYTEVMPGVDYQYTLVGSVIKEDIVLNYAQDSLEFTSELKLGKGLSVKQGTSAIKIYNTKTGADFITLSAPIMIDQAGEVSDGIDILLKAEDGKNPLITVTANKEWLEAKSRAYPVRIDPTIDIAPSAVSLVGVEQGSPNLHIGDNGYPYAGYDDGYVTGNLANYGTAHWICRAYAAINYDFSYIMNEAKIVSATFSVHHYTSFSKGRTNFGLFKVDDAWDKNGITWNSQKELNHTAISYTNAKASGGYLSWDVREVVNNWVQGIYPQRGFVIKAENERNMQCEVFSNKNSASPPRLVIDWEVPDPVDENIILDNITINLRTVTEKDIFGKLLFDGVFADGVATPRSIVNYNLIPKDDKGASEASRSYKYPDSSSWEQYFPGGTKYKDKLSNWQSKLYGQLDENKAYQITASSALNGNTGNEAKSDKFLIYKVKQKDTLPSIAKHYGVPLNTLVADNKVQDTLLMEKNTLFIRNPNTEIAYNPPPLTDTQKKAIDSSLMGRGKHCEFGFEPINLNTGNYLLEATDVSIPDLGGDFSITRTYNSVGERSQSMFGRGWAFSYQESLSLLEDGTITYSTSDGKTLEFAPDGSGGYTSPAGFNLALKKIGYEKDKQTYYRWQITSLDGETKDFNAYGILTEITNAKGYKTTLSYDKDFGLASITSPTGIIYTLELDEHGRTSKITIPSGKILLYTYDEVGNLISYTDAAANTVKYEYDMSMRMSAWYDQNGRRAALNTYDSLGRVTSQKDGLDREITLTYASGKTTAIDALGNKTIYEYDDSFRTTSIRYADGEVEAKNYGENNTLIKDTKGTYTYDERGLKTSETLTDGAPTKVSYNATGQVTSIVQANGDSKSLEYDGRQNLTKVTYADGTTDTYVYDELSRQTSHTNKERNTEYFTYSGANLTSHTNFLGVSTTYAYNAFGQVVSTTDGLGNTTRISYNATGHITGSTDATGANTAYTLDRVGNKVSESDARGYTFNYAYNEVYSLTSITDPHGDTTSYTYDANGNTLSETNPLGATTSFAYDKRGRLIQTTDAKGGVTSCTYDDNDNITSITDALGNTQTTTYNKATNLPTSFTDKAGNTTNFEYTVIGQLRKTTNPNGSVCENVYDAQGRVVETIDEAGLFSKTTYTPTGNLATLDTGGNITTYEYDKCGNLTKTIDALGQTATYAYDKANHLVSITDEAGNTTSYEYDAAGRVLSETDKLGAKTSYTYDKCGNVTSYTDANGNAFVCTYDGLNRLISQTDALGNTTTYTYDKAENISQTADALGQVTSYEYDLQRKLIKTTDPLGQIYTYTHDALGNVLSETAPDGTTKTNEYDAASRLIKSTDAAGLIATFSYDIQGNLSEALTNTGVKETYAYDNASRLIKKTDALGRIATYTYDVHTNTTSETGYDAATVAYTYDALGRSTSSTNAQGAKVIFMRDARGNMTVEQNVSTGAKTIYAYDAKDRLIAKTDANGNEIAYTYDNVGNLIQQIDAKGASTKYTYDKINRLVSATDANAHTTTYTYDKLSRLTELSRPEGGTQTLTYDALDRLIQTKDGTGALTQYAYDSADNLTTQTNALGNKTSYTYDKHGFVLTETDAYKNTTSYEVALDGNVTKITRPNEAVSTYEYDILGRITKAKTPKGLECTFEYDNAGNIRSETDSLGRKIVYSYDELHNLVSFTNPGGYTHGFEYDLDGNLVREADESGATTSFTYDHLGQLTSKTDATGKKSSYTYDAIGNLATETSAAGNTTTYTYDHASNLIKVTDPKKNATAFEYDANGRLTKTTDAKGKSVELSYDAADRVTSIKDKVGASTEYKYDTLGNVTSQADARGSTTNYSYDNLSRLTKVLDAKGQTTELTYDSVHNVTSVKDPRGLSTKYSYDKEDNLTSVTTPAGTVELLEYDMANRLVSLSDPQGAKTNYKYDELDRLIDTSYTKDKNKTVLYSYDERGLTTKRQDHLGDATFEYDALGRVIKEIDAYGRSVVYTYDTSDNLSKITYSDGTSVLYTYDESSNLITVTDKSGTSKYTYDELNRPITLTRLDGSITEYDYDERGSVTSVKNFSADGSGISTYSYTYDELGYVATEDSTVADISGKNIKASRSFTYTPTGEVASFSEKRDAGSTNTTYTYDENGNRTKIVSTGDSPEIVTYAYDKDNRLVSSTSFADGTTTYTYDGAGNLIQQKAQGSEAITYEYSVEDRLESVREGGRLLMAATYDGDGNRTFQLNRYTTPVSESQMLGTGSAASTEDVATDEAERLKDKAQSTSTQTSSAQTTCKYQVDNLDIFFYGVSQGGVQYISALSAPLVPYVSNWLNKAWQPKSDDQNAHPISQSAKPPKADIDVLYSAGLSDADVAEVVSALENNAAAPAIPGVKNYTATNYELTYYLNSTNLENTQVLAEYGRQGALKQTYTYGNTRLSATSATGTTTNFFNDGRGSVTATAQSGGALTSAFTYDALGKATGGTQGELPYFGYNAEETNPTTGMQYLRARYLDIDTSRFGVQDTVLGDPTNPLTLNRYLYALSNPVMQIDPSGHWSLWGALKDAASNTWNGLKAAASTTYNKVIKPASTWLYNKAVKPLCNWTNANIVSPFKQIGTAAITSTFHYMQKAYIGIKQFSVACAQTLDTGASYVSAKAKAIKQELFAFSCGAAKKLGDAWQSAADTLSKVPWDKVGQAALIVGGIAIGGVATVATCGIAGPFVAGLAVGGFAVSSTLAVNDLATITTGVDPLKSGAMALGMDEGAYNTGRGALDVLTALTPGGSKVSGISKLASGGARNLGSVASAAANAGGTASKGAGRADEVSKTVHGNSKASTKAQHGYVIRDTKADPEKNVVKTGISGQLLNKNGSSPRSNTQVNKLNKTEPGRYEAEVVKTDMLDRRTALEWEKATAGRLRSEGNLMTEHRRP